MKVFWSAFLLAVNTAVCVVAITVTTENDPLHPLPQIMYFPDGDGVVRPAKMWGRGEYTEPKMSDLTFKLFSRRSPELGETIIPGDRESLRNSAFNSTLPTCIITHGYLSSITSPTILDIKNMYIGFKHVNVIAVDWSPIADTFFYFIAKSNTVPVGGFVAQFVDFLVKEGGARTSDMHMSGHSLGAHVMGIAGKNLQRLYQNKFSRITGLDPAGPLFSLSDPETRLDIEDADFVDVIHTCAGLLGISGSIGHVDFKPNGGKTPQPGCTIFDYVKAGTCSHSRAWEFFAESINSFNFSSLPCTSYDKFKKGSCDGRTKAPMGEPVPRNVVGKYYLYTAASSPYALG